MRTKIKLCHTCEKRFACFTSKRANRAYFVIRRNLEHNLGDTSPLVCSGGSGGGNSHRSRGLAKRSAGSLNSQYGRDFIYTVESSMCAEAFGYMISVPYEHEDRHRQPFTGEYGIRYD